MTVTVAIPTLRAGPELAECLASLERQNYRDFQVFVVDNSGRGLARQVTDRYAGVEVIENERNIGYGAAINQVWKRCDSPLIAALNDDAVAGSNWLSALAEAAHRNPEAGMFASQVRLAGSADLDSAGMLVAADATSKQRGQRQPAARFSEEEEVLLPSGSAALYRRRMLDETGGFDEAFFLFCEDTDLGLRARRAGWRCLYVPSAIVEHYYSKSAGEASALKAYYVERNRLFVLFKNFPFRMLARAPFATLARYGWHLVGVMQGKGTAARLRDQNAGLLEMAYLAFRAHASLLKHGPRLLRQRRALRRAARMNTHDFEQLLARHSISVREVAAL